MWCKTRALNPLICIAKRLFCPQRALAKRTRSVIIFLRHVVKETGHFSYRGAKPKHLMSSVAIEVSPNNRL